MIEIKIPKDAEYILNTLNEAGHEAYVVGGCVRDALLGRTPMDWDITTSAKPKEVKKLFRRTIDTGIEHGTVTVMCKKIGYEVTTYRIDGAYEDHRRPTSVAFTSDLKEDMLRRDFTINAMAYHPKEGLVDHFRGVEDLENQIIRCVGKPMERFEEDALRILRAIRFSAQLDFTIQEETMEAMKALAVNLKDVSAERIQVEMTKTLLSEHPEQLALASELGVTKMFLPEWDEMMHCEQESPYHCYNVGWHTIHAIKNIPAVSYLRWTMLLHDVAKPKVKTVGEDGKTHFYGHPEPGAKMAGEIMRRMKMDNDTRKKVELLVKWHDYDWGKTMDKITEKRVRRMCLKIGTQGVTDLILVGRADTYGQSTLHREEKLAMLEKANQLLGKIIEENQCVSMKQLAVDGGTLIELGMKPGKELGEVLRELLKQVVDNPSLNTKDQLVNMAKKKI